MAASCLNYGTSLKKDLFYHQNPCILSFTHFTIQKKFNNMQLINFHA